MRHIHNYKSFNEKFSEMSTDAPSVNAAKQYYNKLELDIKEYNDNKDKLKKLYTDINPKDSSLLYNDVNIKIKVDKIIGKTDIKPGKDRSPLLSKYLKQLDIERQIIRKEKTQFDDGQTFKNEKGKEGNEEVTKAIENKMSLNNSDILTLKTDLIKQQKEFNDFMTKEKNELKNSITTISDLSKKIQIGNVVSVKK